MARPNNPIKPLIAFFKELFDLHEDKERESTTIKEISKGVEFKGTNLWILIFAILIASIGLNVNSTAVVIGAMLISPLMGPIMGIGLGAGINDFALIKKALRNLGIAVVISVLTSALYFWITPLHEAQSELLARTYPTLWDVLIAFFGGLAGIVVGSRKEKTNAIPGVAIATALMPPLCTAGYGLANWNWVYFVGAFYLFFINSVFISVATFLIVRFLKYPKKQFEDSGMEIRVKRYISFFVIITIIPSVYLAYHLVQRTLFEQNARYYISTAFDFDETEVILKEFNYSPKEPRIEVTLYGKPLDEDQIENLKKQLPVFKLDGSDLVLHQGYIDQRADDQKFEIMSNQIKLDIVEDLYRQNQAVMQSKDEKIDSLKNELVKYQQTTYEVEEISRQLKLYHENLTDFAMSNALCKNLAGDKVDTVCVAMAGFASPPAKEELEKMNQWLKLYVKRDSVRIIVL